MGKYKDCARQQNLLYVLIEWQKTPFSKALVNET